jgi:predicted RNA binding protein YcfA (HicA-like mRNA interferase family)
MATKVRDLIRILQSHGWYQAAQRGSHRQFKHPARPGRVTVAGKLSKDIPPGTLQNILRQTGLEREDLP